MVQVARSRFVLLGRAMLPRRPFSLFARLLLSFDFLVRELCPDKDNVAAF